MVLDAALLNTQYYKVRMKGKVEQSRESFVAIEKGAFRSPSTTVVNFQIFLSNTNKLQVITWFQVTYNNNPV